MISTLIVLAAALTSAQAQEFDLNHAQYNALLARYVHEGLVDYAGLKSGRADLDAYLAAAGNVPMATFQRWSKDDQLAFLINVYNATTLQLIIDNYPLKSIKSIGSLLKGPWDQDSTALFGKVISLDTLEHKIIRKNYAEPRIHFALVCAALGCPSLRAEAYSGTRLHDQLDDQTRTFLSTPEKNRLDSDKGKLYLSPIFKWYKEDFEATSSSLAAFVAPYMGATDSPDAFEKYDIAFTDYDWSLNDQKAAIN